MPYKKSPSETISKVIQANVVPIEGGWKRGGGGVLKGSRQVLWLAMVNERSPNSQWLPTERKPVIYQPNDRGYFGSLSHWAVNDQLPI